MKEIKEEVFCKHKFENIINGFIQKNDSLMFAIIDKDDLKVLSANNSWAKAFRLNYFESHDIFLENLIHGKDKKISFVLSYIDNKPINNFFYRNYDKKIINLYCYESPNENELILFAMLTEINDELLLESMTSITTDLGNLTRELQVKNNQLEKTTNTMLEQARLGAIGEILHMIAHQWRQPLSQISTLISGLKVEKELGILNIEDMDDNFNKILDITQKLSKTINDLGVLYNYNISGIQTAKLSLILKNILQSIEDDRKSKKIDVSIKGEFSYKVRVELLQCLLSILKNSIEAFDSIDISNPFIKINVEEKNKRLQITIEDNAGGIKKEHLKKIYDPYFSTKSLNGKGLGLYFVKVIICEDLQGEIDLENSEDGLLVKLTLPLNP